MFGAQPALKVQPRNFWTVRGSAVGTCAKTLEALNVRLDRQFRNTVGLDMIAVLDRNDSQSGNVEPPHSEAVWRRSLSCPDLEDDYSSPLRTRTCLAQGTSLYPTKTHDHSLEKYCKHIIWPSSTLQCEWEHLWPWPL